MLQLKTERRNASITHTPSALFHAPFVSDILIQSYKKYGLRNCFCNNNFDLISLVLARANVEGNISQAWLRLKIYNFRC